VAKFHLDRLRKKYGWTGGRYQALMTRIIETNSVSISNAVGRISRENFERAGKKVTGKEQTFTLPDISEALPKRSVFSRKAAERGALLTDELRDNVTRRLRGAIGEFTPKTGEPAFVYQRGKRKGRVNEKLVQEFRKGIQQDFQNYTKKDPRYGVPANIQSIAVTEVRSAADEIKYEYTKKFLLVNADFGAFKVWVHNKALSQNPRPHHMNANGMRIGFYDIFVLENGARLRFPHDPNAPPEEVINCHCDYDIRIRRLT
jgi:hypothetical protein